MTSSRIIGVRKLRHILRKAVGAKCWNVCVGGCTLPQFTLALGEKKKREKPIMNNRLPKVFREFEGEVRFFIRCWWRLEHQNSVVVSSEDTSRPITRGLGQLVGNTLIGIDVQEPAWDLTLEFSGKWRLRAFAGQTENDSPLLKNWHAGIHKYKIYAGPGVLLETATAEPSPEIPRANFSKKQERHLK